MARKKADEATEVVEVVADDVSDEATEVGDDSPETVTLERSFKYAFRGLDVVTFPAGEYKVVDEYDPEAADTIPAEVVAVL